MFSLCEAECLCEYKEDVTMLCTDIHFSYLSCTFVILLCSFHFSLVNDASRQQYEDNIHWIKQAGEHKMVCGP